MTLINLFDRNYHFLDEEKKCRMYECPSIYHLMLKNINDTKCFVLSLVLRHGFIFAYFDAVM